MGGGEGGFIIYRFFAAFWPSCSLEGKSLRARRGNVRESGTVSIVDDDDDDDGGLKWLLIKKRQIIINVRQPFLFLFLFFD